MAKEVEILTSIAAFDKMHDIADGRKEIVKVNREDLQRLLFDHSCMLNALSHEAIKIKAPAPVKRSRVDITE